MTRRERNQSKRSSKRALTSSILAIVLCVVLLAGATFAWFTDTASTKVSKIESGTLKIALEYATAWDNEGNPETWTEADEDTVLEFRKAGENSLWEPGCTFNLPELRISNEGNLAVKYNVQITGIKGDEKLNEAIDWTITAKKADGTVYTSELTEAHSLAVEAKDTLTISGNMLKSAGNEYQGLSIEGVSITVHATQDTVEADSKDNQYDKDATLPTFMADTETLRTALSGTETVVNVALEAGTYAVPAVANKTVTISGGTDTVIDMTQSAMNAAGVNTAGLDITFRGVTVKFANDDYRGIQHSKSVVYENCVLEGKQFMYAENVKFINCTFKNSNDYSVWTYGSTNAEFEGCTFYSGGRAILIYTEDSTHTNNVTVNNCVFYDDGTENKQKAAIEIGDSQPTAGLKVNLTATNNVIYGFAVNDEGTNTGTAMYGNKNSIPADRLNVVCENNTVTTMDANTKLVSTAADLAAALDNTGNPGGEQPARTIVLTKDLDMSTWTGISAGSNYPSVTIEGNGHTLKNLAAPLFINTPGRDYTFKNLTFTNVNINGGDAKHPLGVVIGEGQTNGGGVYTFENCHINGGSVIDTKTDSANDGSSTAYVGGFIGYAANGATLKFTNCAVNNVTVSGYKSTGGFIGHTRSAVEIKDCSILGNTSVTCTENRSGSGAKAGYFIGTIQAATTIESSTVASTATLNNNNAAAPLNGGLVGRNVDGSLTVN